MDCIVHGVAKNKTWLSDFHFQCIKKFKRKTGEKTKWLYPHISAFKKMHKCIKKPFHLFLTFRMILYICPGLLFAADAAKSLQSCPTLCDPIDGSLPGSSVPGILQERTLEWVAISFSNARMHAKLLQSCLTLCDPIDTSPLGSPLPGILQARTLEWVAISFSNAWKWKVKVKSLSRVRLLATPWTAAYQAPPSMGFSRQEYWSGLPLPSLKQVDTTI